MVRGALNGGPPHSPPPAYPLQGHSSLRKLALDLELLIIVQNHQEPHEAEHSSSLSQSGRCRPEVGSRAALG